MNFNHRIYCIIPALFILSSELFANGDIREFSGTISTITIENTGGLPASRIRNITDAENGTEYSEGTIAQHISTLMSSGFLYDVIVTSLSDGVSIDISYSCIPIPMLRSITAEAGTSNKMRRLPAKLIDRLFTIKPGDPFNTVQCVTDLEDIEDMYHAENFHDMRLACQVDFDSLSNVVDMTVAIDRGKKTFAYDIIIQGNYNIDTSAIASRLHCSERSFLQFKPGYYDPRQFAADAKTIQAYYQEEGYLDAEVSVERAQGAKPSRVYVLVRIIEGPQYTLGSVSWKQRVLTSNQFSQLTRKMQFEEGELYYASLPDLTQEIIKEFCVDEIDSTPVIDIAPYMNLQSSPLNPVVDMTIYIRNTRNGYKDPQRIPVKYYQPFTIKPPKK